MSTTLKTSIIIVSYNTRELLLKCLRSIYTYEARDSVEIIVVDNNSTDGSARAVSMIFPDVVLIPQDRNIGFAAANNIGIRRARAMHLLLLNPDTEFVDHTLEPLLHFLDCEQRVDLVGCRILNSDGSLQPSIYPLTGLISTIWVALFLEKLVPLTKVAGRWKIGIPAPQEPVEVERVVGAFMLLRRSTLDKVGLFDESFFMYGEDEDLCYRIKDIGGRIVYFPHVSIVHHGGQSAQQDILATKRYVDISKFHFIAKHKSFPTRIALAAVWYVGLLLRFVAIVFVPSSRRNGLLQMYAQSMKSLAKSVLFLHVPRPSKSQECL
jgi:hypothetical protein